MFERVEFPSESATLRGRLYLPAGSCPSPCVVMAHGTSATLTMVADQYAEAFQAAGFAVLLYDHRNFGASGGEPRQEINPWLQARGYRDAFAFSRSNPRIDFTRIALWGDSYAGLVVLVAGALVEGVAAVVAQIPACGTQLPTVPAGDDCIDLLRRTFTSAEVNGDDWCRVGPLPVVSADQINAPSLLKPIQAYRWFVEYGGRHGSGWENRVTRVVPDTPVPFDAWYTAPHIHAPTLMMVGRDDEMSHCARNVQEGVFARIAAPKTFMEVEGGHFGLLWAPGPLFEKAVRLQMDFLRERLAS